MGWPVGGDFVWHDGVASPGSSPCLCDDSPSVQERWASGGGKHKASVQCSVVQVEEDSEAGASLWSRLSLEESHQAETWPGSLRLAAGLSHGLRGCAQAMGNMGY